MTTLRIGTPGDQAVHDLVKQVATGDILMAEPWDDFDDDGVMWTRLQASDPFGHLFSKQAQCGEVSDRRFNNPRLAQDSRVRWSGGGLRIPRKKFPTREAAMSYVDGELRKAGWMLP